MVDIEVDLEVTKPSKSSGIPRVGTALAAAATRIIVVDRKSRVVIDPNHPAGIIIADRIITSRQQQRQHLTDALAIAMVNRRRLQYVDLLNLSNRPFHSDHFFRKEKISILILQVKIAILWTRRVNPLHRVPPPPIQGRVGRMQMLMMRLVRRRRFIRLPIFAD